VNLRRFLLFQLRSPWFREMKLKFDKFCFILLKLCIFSILGSTEKKSIKVWERLSAPYLQFLLFWRIGDDDLFVSGQSDSFSMHVEEFCFCLCLSFPKKIILKEIYSKTVFFCLGYTDLLFFKNKKNRSGFTDFFCSISPLPIAYSSIRCSLIFIHPF
jgi:hypothetical protein